MLKHELPRTNPAIKFWCPDHSASQPPSRSLTKPLSHDASWNSNTPRGQHSQCWLVTKSLYFHIIVLTSSAASGVTIRLSNTVVTFVTRFWTEAWQSSVRKNPEIILWHYFFRTLKVLTICKIKDSTFFSLNFIHQPMW